jgi:EAL domain-containing protein (putative c-di-GMP-specific phosphodiesterase class I)
MKTPSWKIYSIIKDWAKTPSTLREPSTTESSLVLQNINLEPIFDTQTHLFNGVFCQSFLNCEINELEHLFKECLGNLSYWHCHNRAIRCIVPIRAEHISCPTTHQLICHWISQSDLPVGLLAIAICDLKKDSGVQSELEQFKRLGLEIELFEFTGQTAEFEWLNHFAFDGIHLSLRFIRSIHQSPDQKALLDKTLIYQKAYKFHLYFRGISLVHDFVFAKNYGINFCYGPLMMPAISKHQILKIKESQFANMPSISTPLTHYQDGDPR